MRKANDIKYILRFLGIMLVAEGLMILSCLIPSLHFNDGTWWNITVSGLFTFNVGLLLVVSFRKARQLANQRMAYLLVVLMWVVLVLFGTLPFLATGTLLNFSDALFESTSGITSTGAGTVAFGAGMYQATGAIRAEAGVIDFSNAGTVSGATVAGGAGTISGANFSGLTISLDSWDPTSVPLFDGCTFAGRTSVSFAGDAPGDDLQGILVARYTGAAPSTEGWRIPRKGGSFTAANALASALTATTIAAMTAAYGPNFIRASLNFFAPMVAMPMALATPDQLPLAAAPSACMSPLDFCS